MSNECKEPDASTYPPSTLEYDVTALQLTIYYNREGDHDHNGLMFTLTKNAPILRYIRALASLPGSALHPPEDPSDHYEEARARAEEIDVYLPRTPAEARQPHPLVRPLVLRARKGDTVRIMLQNEIENRWVGPHLVGDGYSVRTDDGSHVGANCHSLTPPDGSRTYTWECHHEGVFPFHDGGNYSGGEDGTNVHGLFGALVVEPRGSIWRDPVTGHRSHEGGKFRELDGLYLDVLPASQMDQPDVEDGSDGPVSNHDWGEPVDYPCFYDVAHREFVIFFHDEPEFLPPHGAQLESPCAEAGYIGGGHGRSGGHGGGGGHGGHEEMLPIMPISYRAEPMINRERRLWQLLASGHQLERPVLNEEQHHSSWMFGDPVTPILKAYIGDPVRIRLVHAAVKETHVFHLHLYEWHAVPQDPSSPRIDAISISPQTAHTIEPVWGAGNRHQVAGDVIWHCHLYPHFHEGMWGMFRTFETFQSGHDGDLLDSNDPVYAGRRIGRYPDGTRIERLLPLPDRKAPPWPTAAEPGYPLYIPGHVQQKSPIPPWPHTAGPMPADYDYRPVPTGLELQAFNNQPVPGELFTRRPFKVGQAEQWSTHSDFLKNGQKEVLHPMAVEMMDIQYNGHGWHDPHGHLFYLQAEGHPALRPGPKEPLFFRARHGQILNLRLQNRTPPVIPGTPFDVPFPPCPALPWEGECAPHVHMVKFDPICADGASVGWNYISGPTFGKRMAYRWWLDQEFGVIFFHDHLFANFRQKHGLFGALLVEPIGARFWHPTEDREIVSGLQARIEFPKDLQKPPPRPPYAPNANWFREFCLGIGDFIPMFDKNGQPLNPPDHPGGHGDQGVMAFNYRNDPIGERKGDPSLWFSSDAPHNRDPYTTLFPTFTDDPVWIRLVQGSHEEQHSFQVHGLRWRRFRGNADSVVRNQQTIGIAEAFTFINLQRFKPGDYLYKLSGADDLWLGCWGLIRALERDTKPWKSYGLRPLSNESGAVTQASADETAVMAYQIETSGTEAAGAHDAPVDESSAHEPASADAREAQVDPAESGADVVPSGGALPSPTVRRFHVVAEPRRVVYRDDDLVDPFGLVYRLISVDGCDVEADPKAPLEPLVLRCREGDTVEVTLYNNLPHNLEPEPFAPEVPVEERDPFSGRPERPVSSHVSMHADLLEYDVKDSDGATVGHNPVQSVPPGGGPITYTWRATRPASNEGEPLGALLLQDMADFRNHRHHGLVGALVVEAPNATPLAVVGDEPTASREVEAWHGSRVTLVYKDESGNVERAEEIVLLLQDGLRLFLRGSIHHPISDEPPGVGEDDVDHEDQGQKAFNYRTEPIGTGRDPDFDPSGNPRPRPDGTLPAQPPRDWLANPNPATPVFHVLQGRKVRFHLVGACDKPRNYSFTIHGVTWPEYRFPSSTQESRVASESAISSGTARTLEFTPEYDGDHAYRSGVLKWAVPQGLWGILRVEQSDLASELTPSAVATDHAATGPDPAAE